MVKVIKVSVQNVSVNLPRVISLIVSLTSRVTMNIEMTGSRVVTVTWKRIENSFC